MEEQADIVSTATSNVENNITPTITQIQSNASNALNTANTANNTANTAKSIAEGANQALSYTNYQAMITAFNELADNVYKVGQNIMIVTLNVPDLWVSAIENTSITYNYTNDEAITTALSTNGYVQVGYYKLSALETQKVDLTDYYTKTGTENKIEDYLYQIMPTDSASGTIATINDATTMFNAIDVSGTINPVQDLHGYDNPWPAGGGANKLDPLKTSVNGSNSSRYGIYVEFNSSTETWTFSGTSTSTGTSVAFNFLQYADTSLSGKSYVIQAFNVSGTGSSCFKNIYGFRTATEDKVAIVFDFSSTQTINITLKVSVAEASQTSWTPYSNICPITGRTGIDVVRCGKNLSPVNNADVQNVGTINNAYNGVLEKIVYKENTQYTISCAINTADTIHSWGVSVFYTDGTKAYLWIHRKTTDSPSVTTASGKSVRKIVFSYDTYFLLGFNNLQIEEGSTATAYEPYQGTTHSISWQTEAGTVYGGTLDVTTGLLTVDRASITFDGSNDENWRKDTTYNYFASAKISGAIDENAKPNNFKSNLFVYGNIANTNDTTGACLIWGGIRVRLPDMSISLAEWTTFLSNNPLQVIYPLAEPVTYQLTPQEVSFLQGTNNLWVDTGDINVTYKADIQKYIDKKTN